jgi:hypothetical protein
VWRYARVLAAGALLTPGKRTVAAALRVTGLSSMRRFERYHRVLNRARWSSLAISSILFGLLVAAFVPDGPLVIGVDETIERRRGARIADKGIYRDAVRSSRSHFVKASGLRWVSLMLLAPIPWARRVWALPFLTALAPSERSDAERRRRHKTLPEWARQLLLVVRRWYPERAIVAVADSSYAALEFLAACRSWANPVTVVTRLRLDAALYEPAPPREPGKVGRPRRKGKRLPTLATVAADAKTVWRSVTVADWYGQGERTVEVASDTAVWYHGGMPTVPLRWVLVRDPKGAFATQALLCTDLDATPEQLLAWFVLRWQLEVTFEEARRHLGMETQRQWSDLAIRRTTPALLGLFSLVTLHAHRQSEHAPTPVRRAAWYPKTQPTFSDALALVRSELWAHEGFALSARDPDSIKLPRKFVEHLTETLCYAA